MINVTRLFLFLSAAILLLVGTMLSFVPDVLYASSGQALPDMVLLRSDLRSGGMLLLIIGAGVLWSALTLRNMRLALGLSALAYLGYGLGRIVSIFFDGPPDATLLLVIGIEWGFGLIALALLWRNQDQSKSSQGAVA